MQGELVLRKIDTYAREAIADLDESILSVIRGIDSNGLDGDVASQVEQYLRIKILFPYEGDNLEADAKRVFARMVEILG